MRWWMTFPMTVVDTLFKAMAKAIPDQIIAGHHADLCVVLLDGFYADTKKLFITQLRPARRRLGRQAQRRWGLGHRLHQ